MTSSSLVQAIGSTPSVSKGARSSVELAVQRRLTNRQILQVCCVIAFSRLTSSPQFFANDEGLLVWLAGGALLLGSSEVRRSLRRVSLERWNDRE